MLLKHRLSLPVSGHHQGAVRRGSARSGRRGLSHRHGEDRPSAGLRPVVRSWILHPDLNPGPPAGCKVYHKCFLGRIIIRDETLEKIWIPVRVGI